ncbi:hypothetical protein BDR04DRAFT_1123940 [Suillus decipiens]|nr:hypothetical protein BDR04DRAFT_1123940 [Suillus decipiens]
MANCWVQGGVKEGQGPRQRQKKEKDKEKANVADAGGDESSNVVYEKCLMACEAIFSAYSSYSTYSARMMLSTVPIIDSGATSHIFADRLIFSHYQPSSGNINGFRDGQSTIQGHGNAKILAHLPSGGSASIKLQISQLNDANCYVLFGAGHCIAFESTDNGQMVEDLLAKSKKILLTATQRPD